MHRAFQDSFANKAAFKKAIKTAESIQANQDYENAIGAEAGADFPAQVTSFMTNIKLLAKYWNHQQLGKRQVDFLNSTLDAATPDFQHLPTAFVTANLSNMKTMGAKVIKDHFCKLCVCHGHHLGECATWKRINKLYGQSKDYKTLWGIKKGSQSGKRTAPFM